jgi:anti-sigma-K factor RskA
MSSVHDHERYEHDVAAYLLSALSELETQAFEQHMEGCAACRDELERLRMAADALPRAVEQVEPPASLKRALMTVVREEAAAAAPARERRGLGARLRERFPRFSTGVRPRVALVSAAFLLIVGIATGYAITQVTSNDNASRTVAAKVDRTRVPQGSASLVIPHGDKNAILRVNGLPEPAGNQVYEVWLMRGNQPMPVSLFNVTSDGSGAAAIPEELHNGDSVLVTREKPGGAPAPTEAPVISARVS